jgi:hypothetical protein
LKCFTAEESLSSSRKTTTEDDTEEVRRLESRWVMSRRPQGTDTPTLPSPSVMATKTRRRRRRRRQPPPPTTTKKRGKEGRSGILGLSPGG